ncbi:sulfatase [Gilvimarinus agarilyticus]|uniref:sulfatase n=1 Tax=Gilvimarinus agarilyticus TaxID=679259 RepID=UPI0005A1C513|nr:sulfatase [Gilvimarinus agarilyticus]
MRSLCFIVLFFITQSAVAAQTKPNILFILSDDAGYADFGYQGSNVMQTPNIDQLAQQGMVFNQAYVSAATCGPSRAGILTGRYQQKFGFEENNVPGYMAEGGLTGDEMGLPLSEKTLGNYLQEQNYTTGIIGKWHQGNADRYHPTKRGFDYFYGFRGGARSYFAFSNENPVSREEDRLEHGFGEYQESPLYLTDALANDAIEFIRTERDNPFFLFLSFNAVHSPMEAREEDLALFPTLEGKRRTLAAMTIAMDRAIGRVLEALDNEGLRDSTLVVYSNDNGGPSDDNASDNTPLAGTKANHLEGGIRVPFIARWPGIIKPASQYEYPISMLDLLPTFYQAAGGDTNAIHEKDGVSLLPYMTGKNDSRPHPTLYWKKENRAAIRDGDWKLLRYPDRPAELYWLPDDISEQNNLAHQKPEKVRELYQKLFAWELTLDRPHWQLKRQYEGDAMKRMDRYRIPGN